MTQTIEFEVDDPSFGHFDVRAEVWMGEKGSRDRYGVQETPDYDPECQSITALDFDGHEVDITLDEWQRLRELAVTKAIEEEEERHYHYDEE